MGKCLLTMATGYNGRHIFYILLQSTDFVTYNVPVHYYFCATDRDTNSFATAIAALSCNPKKCQRIRGNITLCMRQI